VGFADDSRVLAHAGCPEHDACIWLQSKSSAHAVSAGQHEDPRQASQGPWAAISEQNSTGSGWQMPVPIAEFQMQGSPPRQPPVPVHVGKQAPESMTDSGRHAPLGPHSTPVGQSVEQIPDASSWLGVKRRQTRLWQF
jgi:hypothetical protein